ncbi:MAG TPA: ATP synthase F0 subunit B [Candidatus Binatus sp.]|nr:ATP synthase F0 subunit B [Candidatus Binatus sp.]
MTEHGAPHPTPWDLFWAVPNFLIFVAVLVYFLRGPVVEHFRARTARWRKALEEGARAFREASALRAALARDIEALPAAKAQLLADMRAVAELEAEKLIELGRRGAARMLADARLLAEHELAAARQELRRELIEESVRYATALLRNAIRPEDQERFVRDFVARAGAAS